MTTLRNLPKEPDEQPAEEQERQLATPAPTAAPVVPDESVVDSPLTRDQQITRAADTVFHRTSTSGAVPAPRPVTPASTREKSFFHLAPPKGFGVVNFARGVKESAQLTGRILGTLRNPFGLEQNAAQNRADEVAEIIADQPAPTSTAQSAGRIVGSLVPPGPFFFTAEDLTDDPLLAALIAVPGGAAIGSPAAAAFGPLSNAVLTDSRIAIGQMIKQLQKGRAGAAFENAQIVPRASDFAATTRTIDDVMRPNQTKGVSSPASMDAGTGQLREVQLVERPVGGRHGLQIGGPLGPTQRTPEFTVPRVVTNLETQGLSDVRVAIPQGTQEFTAFKKFMVEHSDVLNPDIGTTHVATDGTFEFLFGTYVNPRRAGGTPGAERMYVLFDPANGGRYRITAALPDSAPFGTVTPGDIEVMAKASKDIFGDVMGEAIQPLRETTSPFMATTINAPEVPSSSVDNILENIEAAVAKSRFASLAPSRRRSGAPMGLDMNVPSPRSPHTALLDDLEIPTHEKPITGIQRKWEGARDAEGLAAVNFFRRGQNLLKQQGITDFTAETMRPLFRALHGELDVSRLSPGQRVIYQDVKAYMKAEEADMLNFLSSVKGTKHSVWLAMDAENFLTRMMAHPDYFPRGWKPPPSAASAAGAGRGNLGRTPSFKRARVDATFTELLQSGLEPASWNPYAMVGQRRLTGVNYRESVKLLNRLRVQGATHMVADPRDIPTGFRVPKAGPVFEGRPVPSKTPGHFETTPRVAVANEMADFLESAFGTRFENRFVDFTRKWSNAAKSLKLVSSLFQHVDFGTRGGATAFTPTAIAQGAPLRLPSLGGKLIRSQFSTGARDRLSNELTSGKALIEGRGISYKMIIEEGWSIRGDLSLLKREFGNFMDSPEVSRGLIGKGLENLRKVNNFWQTGLFEGVYRESQKFALDEMILPWLIRTRKGASDRAIAAEAAEAVNILYSTLGNWQTIFKNPHLKEFAHTLMFSTNESEALIRSGLGAISNQHNSGLFREWYLGAFVFLAASANAINFAAKGEPLRKDQYIPINFDDPYSSWLGADIGAGYNSQFLSPVMPLVKGRNGQDTYLDTVGQLDTSFRWALSPNDAATARVNVIPRAGLNQAKGETFNGTKLDTPRERITQLALDLAAPISAGSALEAARAVPRVGEVLPENEGRLGVAGNLVQASGLNLRGQPTEEILNLAALDNPGSPYRTLTPSQREEVKNRAGVKEELELRNDASLEREAPLGVYFSDRDAINDKYRNEEGTGFIDGITTSLGMNKDYRDRLGELHSQRGTELTAHDGSRESVETLEMLQNLTPFTSEQDVANTEWRALFDQVNPETGASGLEDPETGEWDFKLAEQYRRSIVADHGEELVQEIEANRRREYTDFEAHLWATRDILSDNYWNITETEMANSGLTDLHEEFRANRSDSQGFLTLHPEIADALLRANATKLAFRQSNSNIERLLYAWDYIDVPQNPRIQAEVDELRDRSGGVVQDRSGIFAIAEFFGGDILLGVP